MSYDYKETSEEIIIEKGIAAREMFLEYPHGKEYQSYNALKNALYFSSHVPIMLDTTWPHDQPATDMSKAIGTVYLTPCEEKKAAKTQWHFLKKRIPPELLDMIRRKETIPTSPFKWVMVEDDEQEHIRIDSVAILLKQDPRCPIERCGVGVYDSKMPKDDEKIPIDPKGQGNITPQDMSTSPTDSPDVVPEDQRGTKEPPAPKTTPEPEPDVPDAVQAKDHEIQKLQAELDKAKAQVSALREPLVSELTQRGYQLQELNPLSIITLQKMVDQSRTAATEGLPGTVPAPSADTPKTLAEQRAAEQERFEKALKKQQDERFKGW